MVKSQSTLEVVFHFNPADLRDNRSGQISDRQKIRLQIMQVLSPLHIVMAIILITTFASAISFVSFAFTLFQSADWFNLIRALLGIAGIILIHVLLITALIERATKLNRDIQSGRVEVAKGAIAFRRYGRKRLVLAYLMQIDGKEYRITAWQMWAFRKHEQYAVYASPHMQLVLSAEPMRIEE